MGTPAFKRMVGHYNQYYKDGDMEGVNATMIKILNFFPVLLDRIKTESGISMREVERMWREKNGTGDEGL